MVKVVIIHGNGGCTADSYWTPWLKRELEKKGIKVIAPTMPDNIEAKASIWLPYMKNQLKCDEQTIVVGHSSGAIAALRYAEQNRLLGSVLIGAYYTDLGIESERTSGYFDHPWLWDAIKKNQQWIMLLASTDDLYIPIEQAHHIRKHLNAEYHESTGLGHFQTVEIPGLVSLILKKLEKRDFLLNA